MSVQGHLLDITVIGCSKLKDTEWLTKQDPYVVLEYAGNRYRTKTDTDGGRNPSFNEKYTLPLIEGLREINVVVYNSNTVSTDDHIGSGKIYLEKVLTEGYDDTAWPLTSKSGKRSGEVRIIMHYQNTKGKQNSSSSTAPQTYPPSQPGYPPVYSVYAPAGPPQYGSCPGAVYPPAPMYPPGPVYPAPPQQGPYPPQAYPYPAPGAYPPQPAYPYPPQGYPPQHGYAPPPGPYPPY